MIYIAVGCFGFLLIHLFDMVSIKKLPLAKPITWGLGNILLVYALVMVCLQAGKPALPVLSIWVGSPLLIISLFHLLYSLFVNLPFRITYIIAGTGDRLIKSGLYALVRHPGVIWFSLTMLSLVFISQSIFMLTAALIFIFLDIVLVVIQDTFFFGKMFTGYADYRKQTPMLVPNRKSIQTFITSLKQAQT
ncbi:methyltransferase family protein [Chloroflexota bacterium]